LIKIDEKLSSIKLIDQYVFNPPGARIDKLQLSFSKDGRFLIVFSKVNKSIKVFECNSIEKILKDVREDNHIIKYQEANKKLDFEDIFIDDKSKFMIVNYSKMLVVYNIEDICNLKDNYRPSTYVIPEKFEQILDYVFTTIDDKQYVCFVACKVRGMKKIQFIDL
jgi:hypothetical protein